jgi:hypothetical protein
MFLYVAVAYHWPGVSGMSFAVASRYLRVLEPKEPPDGWLF